MAETFEIQVLGQKYYLKGSHDQEYIKRVEDYLKQKIDEVQASGGTVDSYNTLVLVALNLVDECLQQQKSIDDMITSLNEDSEKLINLIDSHI